MVMSVERLSLICPERTNCIQIATSSDKGGEYKLLQVLQDGSFSLFGGMNQDRTNFKLKNGGYIDLQ